jgi:hypothetical protein
LTLITDQEDAMKKVRSDRKLALHTETIRHLRDLAKRDLQQVQGASQIEIERTTSGFCTPACGLQEQ